MDPDSRRVYRGFSEGDLLQAIEKSGYPLQSRAVDIIDAALAPRNFHKQVFEEGSFIDQDTGGARQIDALVQAYFDRSAQLGPHDPGIPKDPRGLLDYEIDFIVECKRSDLPYVFFTRDTLWPPPLPVVMGAPNTEFVIRRSKDDDIPVGMLIDDVVRWPLLEQRTVPGAVSVSKCGRQGNKLELSGLDVFRSITMPLRKATDYFEKLSAGNVEFLYHHIRLVFPIVVLDAPMFSYTQRGSSSELLPVEAVRLSMSQPIESRRPWHGFNEWKSLDFVHIDHLSDYVRQAQDAATTLLTRMDEMALVLLTGEALTDEAHTSDRDPLNFVRPSMTPGEAAAWIRRKSFRIHSHEDEADESED